MNEGLQPLQKKKSAVAIGKRGLGKRRGFGLASLFLEEQGLRNFLL
jgi:hypothetical protein